jgi:microcystin-dependent protein
MADSYTSSLQLVKPEIGASRDTWGSKTNANWDALDGFVSQAMPVGAILDFAGPNAPSGWLICDGRLISRVTYSALFAIIGTYWGAGDGSTTFNLPNMTGRSGVGPGTVTDQGGRQATWGFATSAGFIWNIITQAALPNYALYVDTQGYHSHGGATVAAGAHYHTTDAQGSHQHNTGGTGYGTTAVGDHTHSTWTDTQGDHTHQVYNTFNSGGGGFAAGGFSFGGAQTTSVNGAHGHNIGMAGAGGHGHYIFWDGNHAHTTTWVGDHAHGIYGDGSHAHNVYLNGSGGLFEVQSPIIVVTKIIYAGNQAVARAVGAAAPVTLEGFAEDAEDELAAIREELAQLRTLLGGRPRRRMLSAPLRGPH